MRSGKLRTSPKPLDGVNLQDESIMRKIATALIPHIDINVHNAKAYIRMPKARVGEKLSYECFTRKIEALVINKTIIIDSEDTVFGTNRSLNSVACSMRGVVGAGEIFVNYNVDGWGPLDWWLSYGFVPAEKRGEWTLLESPNYAEIEKRWSENEGEEMYHKGKWEDECEMGVGVGSGSGSGRLQNPEFGVIECEMMKTMESRSVWMLDAWENGIL
tara:strand:+ start:900 stop:1547 length:648 start_codon:yes stop_codon:yes gene_type:complete